MALVFTDQQIKDLTQFVVDAPATIVSFNNDKANLIAQKAKYLGEDDGNAVYTNNWLNIINQYHEEERYLTGVQRTNYNSADIDPAGRLAPGNIHFVTSPPWPNFQPKLDPSNIGLPTSPFAATESNAMGLITSNLNLLKTGFSDGAASTTTTASFVVDEVDVTSASGFAAGHRVLFISGSNFLYGTVVSVTGLKLKITIISASAGFGGIGSGASVSNFFAGFSFSQRESGAGGSPGLTAFMAGLKTTIDGSVSDWETRLNAQLTALNANDASAPEAAEIATARTNAQAAKNVIDAWQAFPSIGVGTSRFGTNLPALETKISGRPAEIAARVAQIPARLGTVVQAGDGTFTGSGNYLKLFETLNARLSKTGGTLRLFYAADLGVVLFDQMIANTTAKQARDGATFTIAKLTANANGTNQVTVDSVAGLSVGNTVKFMSVSEPVVTTTITGISGLVLTLGVVVPATYTVGGGSRVVKQN